MEQQDDLLRDLPLRTKKNRHKKFQYKQSSAIDVKSSLMEMVRSSVKNTAIIDFFKNRFLNQKTISQGKIRPKRVRSETQQQIVGKIEEKNFDFFTGKGQTGHFKRSIDNVISKLNAKITYQPEKSVFEEQQSKEGRSLSALRTKYSKCSKGSWAFGKRKASRKCSTLPGGTLQLSPVLMKDLNQARRKPTNTFLFNIPSRKLPKKTSQVEQIAFQRDWEQQLLENINLLQGTNIRHRKNIKVERERVSSYLKAKFVNEALTTYYKFEPTQSFNFLKGIIEELVQMGEKETRLLTFFTYDANQDGFICEEDIYYFVARLPQHAKILEDFNAIIEFLRNNKLRSTSTNLPEKLLKMRQKSLLTALEEQQPVKEAPSHKRYSFTEKLFTVAGRNDRDSILSQAATQFKKFQINFQVFSLIFAQRMPVLVSQIILSLTRPISQPMLPQQPICHLRSNSPLNKQGEWAIRMGRTREMLQSVQRQNMVLSEKIE